MSLIQQVFESEQFLPHPIELVFAFFSNPQNLPRLMPGWHKARIEEATFSPAPLRPLSSPRYSGPLFDGPVAGSGSRITVTARPFPFSPIRLPWIALIDDFRWNHGFCDLQVEGPFRYWRHCHTLTPKTREGIAGTLLRDKVTYSIPFATVSTFFARAALTYTFNFRHRKAADLLSRATNQPHN